MKKIFSSLLLSLMAVSITACSSDNGTQTISQPSPTSPTEQSVLSYISTEESDNSSEISDETSTEESKEISVDTTNISERLKKSYIDILSSDKFYYETLTELVNSYTGSVDEGYCLGEITAKNGDNFYISVEKGASFNSLGFVLVKNDDGAYMGSSELSDEQLEDFKSYLSVPDTTGYKLESAGSEEYRGKTYDYELYSVPDNPEIKYYFDGDRLAYIIKEPNVIEVKKLTTDVDTSLFRTPQTE